MRIVVAVSAMFFLAGCGTTRQFSGPAPEGALQCALAHGSAAGYRVFGGDVETGRVHLAQRVPPLPAEIQPDPPNLDPVDIPRRDRSDIAVENQMILTDTGGRLEITVVGITELGDRVLPGTNAEELARTILALCTAEPPTFPAA